MYLAEIQEDGLTGLDFLYKHDYILGAKSGPRLNMKPIYLYIRKTHYVVFVDTASIPARSDMIIKGKAENPTLTSGFVVLSTLETNRIGNILVQNTLVELKDTRLPVRSVGRTTLRN